MVPLAADARTHLLVHFGKQTIVLQPGDPVDIDLLAGAPATGVIVDWP